MSKQEPKKISIQYFSILKDESGCADECITTLAKTPKELYEELCQTYSFSLSSDSLRVAINNSFEPWDYPLKSLDQVVFIPPVSGG